MARDPCGASRKAGSTLSVTSPVTGSTSTSAAGANRYRTRRSAAGPDIEQITVPRTTQFAVLRHGVLERSKLVRANRRVSDKRSVIEFENAEWFPIELDEKRQPQLAQLTEDQQCPGPFCPRAVCLRGCARNSGSSPAGASERFGELSPPAQSPISTSTTALKNLVQGRQVLPIEYVFSDPVDPNTGLAGIDLGEYERSGDR
jgi:hypothetical protein